MPQSGQNAGLVDGIYEAAINPEQWPGVLEAIAEATDSRGGVIFCMSSLDFPPSYRTTAQIAPMARMFVESGQFRESVRAKIGFLDPFPEFAPTRNTGKAEGLEDDITTRMLAQVGLGEESTAHIPMPTGDVVTIGIQRAVGLPVHDVGQLRQLNALLPHLSRATMIASRLRMELARSTVEMLELVAIPACVMSRDGRELASNELLGQMSCIVLPAAFGRIALVDSAADRLFQQTLEILSAGLLPAGISIPVAQAPGRDPAVVHLLPLRRSARDILSGGDILVVVTTITSREGRSSPNILAALFDLTPAQARTAAALADGASVPAIAISMGITEKTVRTYIERILAKTGAPKLSDLLVLLSRFKDAAR